MDVITALSLAGTIVQFVDFGSKLLSTGIQLYRSTEGTLTVNEEIELVTSDLRSLVFKLQDPFLRTNVVGPLTQEEDNEQDTFQKVCTQSKQVANELLERLEKLKVKGRRGSKLRKWDSFLQAVRSNWSAEEIAGLTLRLANLKKAVETRVLLSISSNLKSESIRTSSRFDALDRQTQAIISSLVNSNIQVSYSICMAQNASNQLGTLLQVVQRIDRVNEDQHQRTREMILGKQQEERSERQSREKSTRSTTMAIDGYTASIEDGGSRPVHEFIQEITASFEMLSVSDTAEATLRRAVSNKILRSLKYMAMTSRYENLIEAYPSTFEWIFHGSTSEQLPLSNFSRWLESDGGIYWISGKAGSGKSTLMKHIYDDVRTRQLLRAWARRGSHRLGDDVQPCLATFFFWNSGTPEQRSQSALLRALLVQIFESDEALLPVVLPAPWAESYAELVNNAALISKSPSLSLSMSQLMTIFRAVLHQKTVPLHICLLVDGLDEFQGDHWELADFFKEIANCSNVKACLSSRPWVVFQEKFSDCPTLRLQDLTYQDIERYVIGKFGRSQAFQRIALQETKAAPALLREIVDSAAGVFMWVRIVVRSLLSGIINRDDISILLKRLRSLPRELEPLYDYLLGQMEPVYMEWASKAFQIIRTNRELVTRPFGHPLRRDKCNDVLQLSILKFHLAIDESMNFDAFDTTRGSLLYKSMPMICRDTEIYLTARCAGLLEVHPQKQINSESDSSVPYLNSSIEYLHRTVREYLENDAFWPKILSYTTDNKFNSNVALAKACVLLVLRGGSPRIGRGAMVHVYHADSHTSTHQFQNAMLDYLEHLLTTHMTLGWGSKFLGCLSGLDSRLSILILATIFGHTGYVRNRLATDA